MVCPDGVPGWRARAGLGHGPRGSVVCARGVVKNFESSGQNYLTYTSMCGTCSTMIAGAPPPFGKSQSAGYSENHGFGAILTFGAVVRPRGGVLHKSSGSEISINIVYGQTGYIEHILTHHRVGKPTISGFWGFP